MQEPEPTSGSTTTAWQTAPRGRLRNERPAVTDDLLLSARAALGDATGGGHEDALGLSLPR
jgi:hypothetical protein